MTTRRTMLKGGLAAAALTSAPSIVKLRAQPARARTIRAVMQGDLRSLDPIWTTANITAYHGAMIYDTLFALDGEQGFGPAKVKFGDGAGIRVGGVEVALIAHRTQALGTEIFSAVGIDLSTKRYVGVKSTNHFHAAYAPIATKVLYCDGEGPSPLDARKYPFQNARRTIWPHADLPEGRMVV